jgi:hypothetical protein
MRRLNRPRRMPRRCIRIEADRSGQPASNDEVVQAAAGEKVPADGHETNPARAAGFRQGPGGAGSAPPGHCVSGERPPACRAQRAERTGATAAAPRSAMIPPATKTDP